jgi:hypothetical protein
MRTTMGSISATRGGATFVRSATGLVLGAALLLGTKAAHAVGEPEASPTAKGIIGGALLGAEAVMVTEAALDVQPAWAYAVGGGLGAAGGAVGGYFAEQDGDARLPMLLFALGLGFAIPTTVAVLNTTAYEPPADSIQDVSPDEPVADPAGAGTSPAPAPESAPAPSTQPSGSLTQPKAKTHRVQAHRVQAHRVQALRVQALRSAALIGAGLQSDFTPQYLSLNMPLIGVGEVYSPLERQVFGVKQALELRVPLVELHF